MERNWKLGDDLNGDDNLLDGITFNELALTVHCNCQIKTAEAVRKELEAIMDIRRQDMEFLLGKNMDKILKMAKEGVEG